jgi:hypothetical protein
VATLKADEGHEGDAEIHELKCAIAEATGNPQAARPGESSTPRQHLNSTGPFAFS